MDLKGKKILVTGGAGFIGSKTVNAFLERGAKVVVVDDLSAQNKVMNEKTTFYNVNIASPELEDVFKKEQPEIVYHFAFNVLVYKSLEAAIGKESVEAGLNLLSNCQKYGVKKIIFASSGFVYGNTKNIPTKETDPINPASYTISKNTVENYIKLFNEKYGLKYVIFRYTTVYGPGQVAGAMSDYIRKLSINQQSDIWGDGTKTRDYVYIDDVVKANVLALELPEDFKDPVFNVSTAKETSLNDLYSMIAHLLGKEAKPNYLPDRAGEQLRYALDYSKIKNALGWEPHYKLEEGLKKRLKEEGYNHKA